MGGVAPRGILAVAGDPGGANALAPVLALLDGRPDCRVRAWGYRQAADLWPRRGIPTRILGSEDSPTELLRAHATDLLLCATSCNDEEWESAFVAAARELGIPSLALLDFWSNYRPRFRGLGEEDLPDRIAVMDELAVAEMVAEGFPSERLVITGQPVFDALPRIQQSFGPSQRRTLRERLAGEGILVAFISQPLAAMSIMLHGTTRHLGYHEGDVLTLLLDALDHLALVPGPTLALLPHPREEAAAFGTLAGRRTHVWVVRDIPAHHLLLAADLIVGMNSILLMEAHALGCTVLSLQPGLRGPDPLPTNRSGTTLAIHQARDLTSVLGDLLGSEADRSRHLSRLKPWHPLPGATRRVADLALGMIKRNSL